MRRLFKAGLSLLMLVSVAILILYTIQQGTRVQETGTHISDVKRLLGAPTGDVYFLYSEHLADSVSAKIVFDMFENQQVELYYQLNDPWVDSQGCPRPDEIDSSKYIVLFGGPLSQACVRYYEDTSQAAVAITLNDTHVWWETIGGEILEETVTARLEFDAHHDMFLMEFFTDNHGRGVLVFYGYDWRGTWAAALYFREVVYPEISEYRQPYYIFKWVDTNNDGFPSADEVMENRPKHVSVQVTLKNENVDQATVRWFANASHSRGLKVSWYVNAASLDEDVISLLRSYVALGDDVQLSFGNLFFNTLETDGRLSYVDHSMATFKRAFGHYPVLVESYYIDAYTLNYILIRYPFVKGGIAFVNHEVYTDWFKSAGAYYMPYYPSRYNSLVPGKGEDKLDMVVVPFLHRDIANSIVHQSVLYNIGPQDGYKEVENWRTYFKGLFRAFINGWDQFGLALYLIDLTYFYLPRNIIEEDLDFIQAEIESGKCSSTLDNEFIEWFRSKFEESPCYRWIYKDPINQSLLYTWQFTPKNRIGYVNGQLFETRTYKQKVYEECYLTAVQLYDNSMPSE